MRIIMTFLFTVLGILCFAQGGYLRPNTSYGTRQYRLGIDSTFFYPTGSGAPTSLRGYDLKQGAFYFDSTNNKVYNYNPKTAIWTAIGGDFTAGTDRQIIFNNAGVLSGSDNLKFTSLGLNSVLSSRFGDTIYYTKNITGSATDSVLTKDPITGRINMVSIGRLTPITSLPGSNTQVMYRNSTAITGSDDFTFSTGSTVQLSLGTSLSTRNANINGGGGSGFLSLTPGSGGLIFNGISSGDLTDSILTQTTATGKVRRISPNRFTLQQITTNGNSTTNQINTNNLIVVTDPGYLLLLNPGAPSKRYSLSNDGNGMIGYEQSASKYLFRATIDSFSVNRSLYVNGPTIDTSLRFHVLGNGRISGTAFLGGINVMSGASVFFGMGSPGTGKVLTSDATGFASWQTPTTPSSATLQAVTTNGNTATNNIILGSTSSSTANSYQLQRQVSDAYTGSMVLSNIAPATVGITFNAMDITTSTSTYLGLPANPSNGPYYAPNSSTIYRLLHQNNVTGLNNIKIATTTDGISITDSVPGANTQVMYRNSTRIIGSNDFTFSTGSTVQLSLGTSSSSTNANINGGGGSGFLSLTPGSGGLILNGISSGSLTDSILTQTTSTGKLTRISPSRFTFQSVTNNGNTTNNDVYFGNHLYFNTTAPSITLSSGASWTGTFSINGSDQSGQIAIVISSGTGSASTGGDLLSITFGQAFSGSTPRVIVTAADNATAAAFSRIFGTVATSTGWRLSTTPALSGIVAGQYFFNYHVF